MTRLLDLPPETLINTLKFLAEVDFSCLIRAQLTCQAFQSIIRNIVFGRGAASGSPSVHSLLRSKFRGLFDSKDWKGLTSPYDGDPRTRFRQLPWAATDSTRAPWLRPDASWRQLSVTALRLPITHLDLLKASSSWGRTSLHYAQVELPPQGLTMGLFYDLLLSGASCGGDISSWQLVLGKKLESYDEWQRMNNRGLYGPSDNQLRSLFVEDGSSKQSAIFFTSSSSGCVLPSWSLEELEAQAQLWQPRIIGDHPPKCLPWQGTSLKPDTTYADQVYVAAMNPLPDEEDDL
ncbi:Uu.00g114530.m01.CDS01 [Anthostomella pinea]|uniref:Uu.00g114530.m01.CDS01 n=1 Tax=Anthostomella pinea TaxID=933095 RepID=A0AAI8VGR2_9PEZI|nr:Uu.00g114530.m01.CDS01 [Anthostomella pinea]